MIMMMHKTITATRRIEVVHPKKIAAIRGAGCTALQLPANKEINTVTQEL